MKISSYETLTDQRPSTSKQCKKSISQSPWKSAGGKVNRFKKIVDDQAKKKIRRSVYIVKDNQVLRKMTPKRICSPQRKFRKSLINKRKRNAKKPKKSSTLEEGEILSDPDKSLESNKADSTSKCEADGDDCFVIEPTLEEITIDDNDDDNIPSTSDITINYQSLLCSFKERTSSTPYHKKISAASNEAVVDTEINVDKKPKDNNVLPYFVDVDPSYGIESINSTENFSDYIKFSTLKEKEKTTVGTVRLKQNSDDCEVIDLDDTSNDGADATLKCKSCDGDDDSVIFIGETSKNDFIPIVGDNKPKSSHKPLTLSEPIAQTPAKRLRTNNLFTQSETKKLNEYNDNAYNPSATRVLTSGKRMVIIDGSNVAFKHGLDQEFSVKGLKIAIEYFEKMGHEVKAVIPQFRMNKSKSTNPEELERLHKAGKIVQTPCKNLPGYVSTSYDDRFILQLAFALDAAIVSNDNYRDLLHENPAFRKIVENRVIGYTWCNDVFILPKDPYGKWGPTLHTILNRF